MLTKRKDSKSSNYKPRKKSAKSLNRSKLKRSTAQLPNWWQKFYNSKEFLDLLSKIPIANKIFTRAQKIYYLHKFYQWIRKNFGGLLDYLAIKMKQDPKVFRKWINRTFWVTIAIYIGKFLHGISRQER